MIIFDERKRLVCAAWMLWEATCPAQVIAHEFWIDPEIPALSADDRLTAQLRVGQNLAGEPFPWLSRSILSAVHARNGTVDRITGREGDLPALSVGAEVEGLHVLAVQTRPAYVTFDGLAAFADYLDYEGLGGIVAQHRARGLGDGPVSEAYVRHARALVWVGEAADGQPDAPVGLPFELVVDGTPFAAGILEIAVSLEWLGEPVPDTQVSVFHRSKGAEATRTLALTDANGRANIRLAGPGEYLLNAVRMDAVDGPGSVRWQSHWASLSFEILP